VPREPTPLYLVFDGSALDGLLYRIVRRCPPTLDDFRSYEALGKTYNRRDFFKGIGVSTHTSHRRAVSIARRFGHGRAVATVDLRAAPIVWARTGAQGQTRSGVWLKPDSVVQTRSGVWLKPDPVVQCDEHE